MNDIRVDYYVFLVGKLNDIIVLQTKIPLDVKFQDGGGKTAHTKSTNAVNSYSLVSERYVQN